MVIQPTKGSNKLVCTDDIKSKECNIAKCKNWFHQEEDWGFQALRSEHIERDDLLKTKQTLDFKSPMKLKQVNNSFDFKFNKFEMNFENTIFKIWEETDDGKIENLQDIFTFRRCHVPSDEQAFLDYDYLIVNGATGFLFVLTERCSTCNSGSLWVACSEYDERAKQNAPNGLTKLSTWHRLYERSSGDYLQAKVFNHQNFWLMISKTADNQGALYFFGVYSENNSHMVGITKFIHMQNHDFNKKGYFIAKNTMKHGIPILDESFISATEYYDRPDSNNPFVFYAHMWNQKKYVQETYFIVTDMRLYPPNKYNNFSKDNHQLLVVLTVRKILKWQEEINQGDFRRYYSADIMKVYCYTDRKCWWIPEDYASVSKSNNAQNQDKRYEFNVYETILYSAEYKNGQNRIQIRVNRTYKIGEHNQTQTIRDLSKKTKTGDNKHRWMFGYNNNWPQIHTCERNGQHRKQFLYNLGREIFIAFSKVRTPWGDRWFFFVWKSRLF